MTQQLSSTRFVAAGIGAAAVLATGAALLAVRPWQHDERAPATHHRAPNPSATAHPTGPVLHHSAVERFLVDLEDATSPTCNGGADIAAKIGRTFTCVDGAKHWQIRISEIDPDGGIHYELAD